MSRYRLQRVKTGTKVGVLRDGWNRIKIQYIYPKAESRFRRRSSWLSHFDITMSRGRRRRPRSIREVKWQRLRARSRSH